MRGAKPRGELRATRAPTPVALNSNESQPETYASAAANHALPVIVLRHCSEAGVFGVTSGFKRGFTITDSIAWKWKIELVSDERLSHVSAPLVITPLVAGITPFVVDPLAITPSCYHAICSLAEVYRRSSAIVFTVSTPPRYRPPGCVKRGDEGNRRM